MSDLLFSPLDCPWLSCVWGCGTQLIKRWLKIKLSRGIGDAVSVQRPCRAYVDNFMICHVDPLPRNIFHSHTQTKVHTDKVGPFWEAALSREIIFRCCPQTSSAWIRHVLNAVVISVQLLSWPVEFSSDRLEIPTTTTVTSKPMTKVLNSRI